MLLFDLTAMQAIGSIKRHGGGKYAEMIFRELVASGQKFHCYYDSNRWINKDIITLCRENGIEIFDIQKESLSLIVDKSHTTKVYSALDGTGFETLSCKKIITIHGLRIFETPDDDYKFKYKYRIKEWIKEKIKSRFSSLYLKRKHQEYVTRYFSDSLTSIITVSNHSKNALITYFPEIRERGINVDVFYSPSTSINNSDETFKHPKPYFLIVSGNRWIKNAVRAIIAFERLKDNGYYRNYDLIVTGVNNSFIYQTKHPESIIYRGYVEESELESLYKNAFALIYPSLNEGFGYPPLEAMKYGTPVISSSFTSIPEVCGEAALYFNPLSIEEIMNRMLQIEDKDLYANLSTKSIERYKKVNAKQNSDLQELVKMLID